jgi:hypothetical protein
MEKPNVPITLTKLTPNVASETINSTIRNTAAAIQNPNGHAPTVTVSHNLAIVTEKLLVKTNLMKLLKNAASRATNTSHPRNVDAKRDNGNVPTETVFQNPLTVTEKLNAKTHLMSHKRTAASRNSHSTLLKSVAATLSLSSPVNQVSA